MPTLEAVVARIKQIGATDVLQKREVDELPTILWQDEQIEKIVKGAYEQVGNKSRTDSKKLLLGIPGGVLVATDRRLIFVSKGIFRGLHIEDILYDKLTSIHYTGGLASGTIIVAFYGNSSRLENVNKMQARDLTEYVRTRVAELQATPHNIPQRNENQPITMDLASQLERLAQLKDQGILTDEEFATQKRKLLDG